MTEEQLDQVHDLNELLWTAVHDLVDDTLKGVEAEVAELVRTQMTEQFRFWKRQC